MDEIVDAVAVGVHTGDECGPCHRALRRRSRLQWLEITLAAQPVEIGQRAPVLLDELRVHAVYAENDDAPAGRLRPRDSATGGQQERGD